ncbi:acyltransferase family protein [Actinokineospora enzanensis]|uniref:acyltransferase family protein n=1 Tax=Actinokineospora enzanensis TaxID=155975 RepID=UPI0003811DD6|nr:acyltransferase [Actinokineospora enzanensis]
MLSSDRTSTVHTRQPTGSLDTLTGLRFAAAILVFATHISANRMFGSQAVDDALFLVFGRIGWFSVTFFFVLSGFIMAWSPRAGDTARSFWRRRAAKVFPNHLVTMFAAVILMLATARMVNPSALCANTFLLSTWFPSLPIYDSPNGLSWSLCCEAFFYLAFPLLHKVIRRIPSRWLWTCAGLVVAAIMVIPAVAMTLPTTPVTPWASTIPFWHYWLVYSLPPVRALDFVLGILLARIVHTGRWIPLGLGPAALLMVPAYVVMLVVPPQFAMNAVCVVPMGLLVAAGAVGDTRGARSPFRARTWVQLGELSFAFYMVHELVIRYGLRVLNENKYVLGGVVLTVFFFVTSLLLARLLYRHVEVPAQRFFGRPRAARTLT